jgi:cation diffusion facilitator family transporter
MAEIAAAAILLRVPVVGQLDQWRGFRRGAGEVARRGQEHQGEAAPVAFCAADFDHSEFLNEKIEGGVEIADPNHAVKIAHCRSSCPAAGTVRALVSTNAATLPRRAAICYLTRRKVGGLPLTDAALKEKVAFSSIAASFLLTVGKIAAGLASGSLALLSEGAHNALDTGATILTFFAVREANKPADERHPYGHTKFESLSALAETGLLAGLACYVLVAAIHRLWEGAERVDASWPVFAVLFVSIAVDTTRWLTLGAVARKTGSHALAADAMHFASDLIGTTLVLAGLAANSLGFHQGDALAALGVALFIGYAGYHLGSKTVETLLDAAPIGLADRLRGAIMAIPGVVAVEDLKLRANGPEVLGEVTIGVPRTLPVERLIKIERSVQAKIAEISPETHASVITSPRTLDEETITERVMMIAARRDLGVHHVIVQRLGSRECIAFDLEIDGAMAQGEAHEIATALENEIRDEFGGEIEVESHIEPRRDHTLTGHDADAATVAQISECLRKLAVAGGVLQGVHDIRARRTEEGLVVNFHATVDPSLSVAATHDAVDRLERALRERTPGLLRVVGHAEPVGAG